MRVVVAPDSFKGSISATDAASALGAGWRSARPGDTVIEVPLADGGEGTLDVIARARPEAHRVVCRVRSPVGEPIEAAYLRLGSVAFVEMAQASGLPLLREPAPLRASTSGTGDLVVAAMGAGAQDIVVTSGGSATTDGGAGVLSALGAEFWGRDGLLPPGGGALEHLEHTDWTAFGRPPGDVEVLVDVTNPLLGPAGAAATFAPQKGASASDVETLERGLRRLADHLGGNPSAPGAGAGGGLAYGLAAACDARLRSGCDVVFSLTELAAHVAAADLILTGEGALDETSFAGKVVGRVVELGATHGVPVVVVAGSVRAAVPDGLTAVALREMVDSDDAAISSAAALLERAAAGVADRFSARSGV